MSKTGAPKATAQGTLAKTPFAHLMQFIISRELTGTLAVWPDPAASATGRADAASTAGSGQDRVLFESGSPVAMRCIEPAANLAAGLVRLFARRAAPYAFYERQNLLGRSSAVVRDSLDPLAVLSLGVRSHATDAQIEPVLRQLGARPVRVRVGFDVQRLGLRPEETAIVEELRKRAMTVNEAIEGHAPGLAHRVVYLLTLVKGLESLEASALRSWRPSGPPGAFSARTPHGPAADGQTSTAPATPPGSFSGRTPALPSPAAEQDALPPKPHSLSSEDATRWDEFVALYRKLDDLNHFELLGVESTATTSDITSAYFALVKRWHPERVGQALEPLRQPLQELFERITEAHEILSTDDKRAAYVRTVQEGGGTRRAEKEMANVVEAAMDIQKAEVLLRRRSYHEALELVEQAIAKSPGEAGNYALRGWLKLLLAPAGQVPPDAVLRDIDHTLADNDRNAKAHYYKGVVLKRRGESNAALRHFARASELDPRNIEAQREVRLANIRRHSTRPPKKQGLWGKLFSKN